MSVSKCRVVLQLRPSGVAKAPARSEQYVVRVHHIPRTIGRDCPDCSCGESAKESEEEESEEDEISSWLGAQVHVLARRFNTCFRRDTALNFEYDAQINALNVEGKLNH